MKEKNRHVKEGRTDHPHSEHKKIGGDCHSHHQHMVNIW
jgi:hypothetical protein